MAVYLQSALNTMIGYMVSGSYSAAVFLNVANNAVREVLLDIDMRSFIRKTALSPNLFDETYQYTCPTSLKAEAVIDVKPQINRGRYDRWDLITAEEFDRKKQDLRVDQYGDPFELKGTQWLGNNLIAFSEDDMVRKLLLSRPIDDTETGIDTLDALGSWVLFGDGTNLTKDSDNYVKGSGCINWDISDAGGTTAGIQHTSLDTYDVSAYKTNGSIFVWAYISSTTNLTNFIIRVGSSSSAYYYITITTNNEGNAFETGWNLLRFDFINKSTTGTPDDDACDYCVLYMTKDAGKVSETDYRFDNIVMKIGNHYDVIFYSKYGWQNSSGTWLENATTTTDYLNCDTDENNIIAEKTAELMEQYLKNYGEADRHRNKYEALKKQYVKDNPSKALPLIQEYYDL